jgi:hypothetical protein
VDLVRTSGRPVSPGQWSYDQSADTLYVWLLNGADPNDPSNFVVPFDWRPFQDEIDRVWIDDTGNLTKVQRLAHTFSNWGNTSAYYDTPRAAVDPSGQFIMFTSNWDGSGRRDVYILRDPTLDPTYTLPDPTALSISQFSLLPQVSQPTLVNPEPGTLTLMTSGLGGWAVRRWIRSRPATRNRSA